MKIIAIGRNYSDHIKELNSKRLSNPIIFQKTDSAIIRNNKPFFYPDFSENINYETEIVLKINKIGKNISRKFAHRYYNEIGLGIDFTARDLQNECKKNGLPWDMAKSFDGSAPISEFIDKQYFKDINNINFSLKLNGEYVQKGNTGHMLYSVDELISYISRFFTLKIGDLIFTGTPAGVGEVKINDRLEGYIEDRKMLDFFVK